MARLPQPGSDQGTWGDILNDYLSQAHNTDGSLKNDIVTEAQLAAPVVTKLNVVAGQQGATGPAGPSGPQGATGATGVAGTQGAVGATGATGLQGTAGPVGATGAAGPSGATGPAGTSVTITGAVANAAALPTGLGSGDAGKGYITNDDGHLHVWSGSSWTDVGVVRGPSGPQGATGAVGATGASGAAGPQGATGPTGTAGSNGATGATGSVGATGAQGPQGPSGGSTYTFVTTTSSMTAVSGQYIFANAASNAIIITLPAPAVNAYFSVKKIDGGSFPITISGSSAIDGTSGSTGVDIYSQRWASQDFLSDGTQWYQV